MWSSSSIRSPGFNPGRTPPAALVSSSVLAPIARITRMGSATAPPSHPSYRWKRPCIATTSTPSQVPATSAPACPVTVDRGNPGISSYGIRTASPISSASPPSPEPRTSSAAGARVTRSRRKHTVS
jgi:hypothetical protein